MNKFGLLDDDEELGPDVGQSLSEKLAAFPLAAPRHAVDLAAVDAAAAPHGFISREAGPAQGSGSGTHGRRRRVIATEPTRHLAIRLTASQYERFVAYADRHKLTYHDALARLLDESRT